MHLAALRTPTGMALMLRDRDGHDRELDLLDHTRFIACRLQPLPAVRTDLQEIMVYRLCKLFGGEQETFVLRMARLAANVAFVLSWGRGRFGWLDNIGRGGFGRGRRVFPGSSQLRLHAGQVGFQGREQSRKGIKLAGAGLEKVEESFRAAASGPCTLARLTSRAANRAVKASSWACWTRTCSSKRWQLAQGVVAGSPMLVYAIPFLVGGKLPLAFSIAERVTDTIRNAVNGYVIVKREGLLMSIDIITMSLGLCCVFCSVLAYQPPVEQQSEEINLNDLPGLNRPFKIAPYVRVAAMLQH